MEQADRRLLAAVVILADGVPPALDRELAALQGRVEVVILADGVPPALAARCQPSQLAGGLVVILADGVPPALVSCPDMPDLPAWKL